MKELNVEVNDKNRNKIEDEFGDVLFTLINYSRFLKIDPELSLKKSTEKFIGRFKILEEIIKRKKQKISQINKNVLDYSQVDQFAFLSHQFFSLFSFLPSFFPHQTSN